MTCSTYTKRAKVLHMIYIVFLSVFSAMVTYSAVFGVLHMSCAEDRIALCFTVFLALLALSVDFFECRAMAARLFMNDDGIGVRRFGKVKVFIRWDEVKEIGIGRIPTPFGSKERAYFCGRELDEKERKDLVTLKYYTVHFSHIPKEWYQEMCSRLPIPFPAEVKGKYVVGD